MGLRHGNLRGVGLSRGPEVRGKLVPGNDSHAHSLQALGLLMSRRLHREGWEMKGGQ